MKAIALTGVLVACGSSAEPSIVPDAGLEPDAAPAQWVALPPAPANWLLLFDRSTTWAERFDRFLGLKDAVSAFLAERGDAFTLAATSFPHYAGDALDCDPAGYDTAELAWGTAAATIAQTIVDEWSYVGTSTLGPALEGAGRIATERHAAMPGHSTSIVLLTDAAPNEDEECESSAWEVVAQTAGAIFDNGHGPSVHVLNVMGTAISPDHPAKLSAIAAQGGGFAAFVNGSRTDIATSARHELAFFDARATVCTRSVPAGLVPANIRVSSPDGSVFDATRVADASACQGAAFYLDDPTAPTTLTLCSGEAGIGGFCEMTYWRAETAGAPTITAR